MKRAPCRQRQRDCAERLGPGVLRMQGKTSISLEGVTQGGIRELPRMKDRIKILVVEDDPDLLALTSEVLSSAGYAVVEVATGKDALEAVKQARPGIVLLDVVLPDMSGLEVCKQIKADPGLRNILVVLLSGVSTSSEAKTMGLDLGADGYIVKPIPNKELLARVHSFVRIKEAEDILRASEKRYRSYIEVTGQLAWTTNADGQVVEDLPAWRRFTGQTKEEMKSAGWASALHPDDVEQTVQVWKKAVATKTAYEVEYRIRRYDGVYRHFLARAVPLATEDGSVREWVGTCIDITERKLAEEALKEARDELERRVVERTAELSRTNEQLKQEIERRRRTEEALQLERNKLEGILRLMNDGVCIVNQNCTIEYVNPVLERQFGSATGRTCHEYFHGSQEVCSWCNNEEVFSGKTVQWEWSSPKTERTYEVYETPIVNADGTISKLGMVHDITGRKQADQALRESEERYRTLIETMNDGLGVYDEGGVWTYANEKFCRMLGHPCDEIVGRPGAMWLDEGNRKIFDELLASQRDGGQEPYELAWVRKDGVAVHTYVSPKPVIDVHGRFKGSFAVYTDITERKQTEDSLRTALSEIKALKDRLEAENIYFRQEMTMKHQFGHIVGQSNALKYVLYRAEQVAPVNTTVLVLGETGTGKELIAAAIHQMSLRKDRPLVIVNCAALPANLIESELFGREKGAFTGADVRRVGRFEIANGSTLCLDEIGELPLEVQGKLLRVIQHGEFQRLGSPYTVKVDVRLVATTNRNLEEEVRKGRFRKDLYYRLNVFPITVPPLRQRKEDIPMLVQTFVERFSRKLGKRITSIPKETMQVLQEYEWPGNIRELENVIERAVILCQGPVFQMTDKFGNSSLSSAPSGLKTLEETERDQILKALEQTRWRVNGEHGAAAILDLNPSTLRARMQKLGIRRPEVRALD